MFVRADENEHGTPLTVHKCDECGNEFTVTPAVPAERRDEWNMCMAESCPSYEPTRDAELYFGLDMVSSRPTPQQAAWTRLNQILDAGGGDTSEYRVAWDEWVRAASDSEDDQKVA